MSIVQNSIRRRSVLMALGLGAVAPALPQFSPRANAVPGDPVVLGETGGVHLATTAEGAVQLRVGDVVVETINGVYFTGEVSSLHGIASQGQWQQTPAIVVAYDQLPAGYSATGYFMLVDGHLELRVEALAPEGVNGEYFMLWRSFPDEWTRKSAGLWEWARDARGGIPFQRPVVSSYSSQMAGVPVTEMVVRNVAEWTNERAIHAPFERSATGTWTFKYVVVPGDVPRDAMAGMMSGRTLSISARTAHKFHWWHSASAALEVELVLYNSAAAREVELTWSIHDFYGSQIANVTWQGRIEPGQSVRRLTTPEVPQGIYFLEATAVDGPTTALTRLNLTVMPDKQLDLPTSSPFGLSAVFSEWGADYGITRDDWAALVQRMGVKHLRHPQLDKATRARIGVDTNHHTWIEGNEFRNGQVWPNGTLDVAARNASFTAIVDACNAESAVYEEYGNELNMKGGVLKGEFVDAYMEDYLKPLRSYFDEHGCTAKLTLQALAGPDYVFLDKCVERGAWPLIDAVVLHPGRGNYAPDWAPSPDDWDYWNYLGGIRAIREHMRRHELATGVAKPLLLSEVYAPTFPNSWWEDTYRTSAENVLLTAATAMSEGVERFYWYQLNDSTWMSPGTANDKDREWHFGMVMIDTSFKPMLLAYANAAEHLGDATFKRWLSFDDPDIKGLLFDSPRGELQVIWSRADGYVLNSDHGEDKFYDEPEPWVDVWPTKKTIRLKPSPAGKQVTVYDCIGTQTHLAVSRGRVEMVVDGAPKIYYGLKA